MKTSRRYPRAVVNLPTDIWLLGECPSPTTAGRFLILSATGAWIEVSDRYPVGASLLLRFALPPTNYPIACEGVVRNRVNRRGIGVEFLDLSPQEIKQITAYVQRPE